MNKGRRRLNISLIVLSLLLAGWAARICRQPSPSHTDHSAKSSISRNIAAPDTPTIPTSDGDIITAHTSAGTSADDISPTASGTDHTTTYTSQASFKGKMTTTTMLDADIRRMRGGEHPFGTEARKVLSGRLEESDSISRHLILSYCEHLRTSYTTRDIDFLRQVFSDDALIIVGHTVRNADASSPKGTPKVSYSIRSKHEYLKRLSRIFDSGKEIVLYFSDFRILRHPTMEGIYGVTLRQKYSAGNYADEGWLFLLWDFRDPSMPLIHVRTWQPSRTISGEDDLIDMSDFNLE